MSVFTSRFKFHFNEALAATKKMVKANFTRHGEKLPTPLGWAALAVGAAVGIPVGIMLLQAAPVLVSALMIGGGLAAGITASYLAPARQDDIAIPVMSAPMFVPGAVAAGAFAGAAALVTLAGKTMTAFNAARQDARNAAPAPQTAAATPRGPAAVA